MIGTTNQMRLICRGEAARVQRTETIKEIKLDTDQKLINSYNQM